MSELPSPPRYSKRRIAAIISLVFALFLAYRIFGVYTVRFGTCHFPIAPAELVRVGAPRFPARTEAARKARSLVVMSYNAEGHASLFRPDHLERLAQVIRENKPDVVGLQEVHRGTWQARFDDQAEELARLTGMNSAYGTSFIFLGGEFGNAVLTRGRIINSRVYPLPSVGEPRSLLETTVDIDGNRLNFYVTHLATWGALNRRSRLEQIQCIAEHVRRSPYPYIVVGDFNAVADTPEIRWFRQSAVVLMPGIPTEPTHKLTQQHLDYIFADPGWDPKTSRVLRAGPSDHYPLLAELEWENRGG